MPRGQNLKNRPSKHLTQHPLYHMWGGMKWRCYNKDHSSYHRYSGRGIKMCERWRFSFENFLSDMGERPEGSELHRIDNKDDYEPSNCAWINRSEHKRMHQQGVRRIYLCRS